MPARRLTACAGTLDSLGPFRGAPGDLPGRGRPATDNPPFPCRPSTSWCARAARSSRSGPSRPCSTPVRRSAAFASRSRLRRPRSRTRRCARSRASVCRTARRSPPTSPAKGTTCRSTRSCSFAVAASVTFPEFAITSCAGRSTPPCGRFAPRPGPFQVRHQAPEEVETRECPAISSRPRQHQKPDPKFGSMLATKLINKIMLGRQEEHRAEDLLRCTWTSRPRRSPRSRSRSEIFEKCRRTTSGPMRRGALQARRWCELPGAARGEEARASRASRSAGSSTTPARRRASPWR